MHTAPHAQPPPRPPSLATPPHTLDLPGLAGPLYVLGTLPTRSVAVVGARASDPYGLAVSRQIATDLARSGWAVVSGGAEGCDRAAHEGALAAGGATVVVLPAGHNHLYPRHHAPLFEAILAQGGAVVSPFLPDTPIARFRFLQRNRTIAALSRGVIVTRARTRSGSLSTARAAQSLDRRIGAVPGAIGEALSEGCHELLEDGAATIASPGALIRWLECPDHDNLLPTRWPCRPLGQAAPWPDTPITSTSCLQSSPEQRAVLDTLRREPGLDLDGMAVRTGIPFAVLATAVLSLELAGRLNRWPGGRYIVNDP